jgi:hypothetical protein
VTHVIDPRRVVLGLCGLALFAIAAHVHAQHAGAFRGSLDDPAIAYATAPLDNVVSDVNRKLQDGAVQFAFDGRSGFLQSALNALKIPIDSQLLVFSRGSLQGKRIGEQNPRAIFFNDRVALGWVRDGDVLEVAAHDASAGVVFYTLENLASGPVRGAALSGPPAPPQFKRAFVCLGCHVTGDTLGVPGLLMFSTTPAEPGKFDGVPRHIDQSDPFEQRFGGWFVTGNAGSLRHMGKAVASVDGLFDTDGYRALSSDIVSHLVLTHQAGMTNLLTRAGWEARIAQGSPDAVAAVMTGIAREVVDHMLFLDEATLPAPVRGSSGFAERFAASGPRDRKGRSLYELDLTRRLFKYPCSYLIYSPAFDALPARAKDAIYRRLWEVLSGQERDERYRVALPLMIRRTIVEMLRDTKKDLPGYFTP